MGNTNNEDTVWCFDATNGKTLWRHTYTAQLGPQWYEGGPGSTPSARGARGGAHAGRTAGSRALRAVSAGFDIQAGHRHGGTARRCLAHAPHLPVPPAG